MKNSFKDIENRRKQLLAALQLEKTLSVKALSQQFSVSEITMRRDLAALKKMGLIERQHGKASIFEAEHADVQQEEIEQLKAALAKRAAAFIKDGDTVFVNTSSTALAALHYLEEKRVTVVTNNVKAVNLEYHPNATVILSGGEIRFPKEALVGDIAIDSFSKMSSNLSIIGFSGISVANGLTTPVLHESKINSLIMERTNGLVIVVADYRKLGVSSNFTSGMLKEINYLITDCFSAPETIRAIEKQGVQVIQVATS